MIAFKFISFLFRYQSLCAILCKNIILEIRAGAGGDEASLFSEELFTGYTRFANTEGWSVSLMSISEGNVGGFKEVIASISGDNVFSKLKYESGVHRVQRCAAARLSEDDGSERKIQRACHPGCVGCMLHVGGIEEAGVHLPVIL